MLRITNFNKLILSLLILSYSLYAKVTKEQSLSKEINTTSFKLEQLEQNINETKNKKHKLTRNLKILQVENKLEELKNKDKNLLYISNYINSSKSTNKNKLCYLRGEAYQQVESAFLLLDNNIKIDRDILESLINKTKNIIKQSASITCKPTVRDRELIIYSKIAKHRLLLDNPFMENKADIIDFGKIGKQRIIKIARGTFVKLLNIIIVNNIKWAKIKVNYSNKERTGWITLKNLRKVCQN